jgi:DNA-binding GntR family transcriptional regulator
MTRVAAISRSVLSDQVKDRLLQGILDGRYPPGARIVETQVARELGTSQAPVREALRDLEALGVVETTAFRGARVRRPSAAELLEAFVIRAELESLAARLAIPRLTEDDVKQLAEYVRMMQRAALAGDTYAEATADAAFHGRVVALAGNETLGRVWRTLEPFSRTYITIVAPGADGLAIADEHVPVLDALKRRDADLAVAVLHRHFANAAAMLGSHWADDGPTAAPKQDRNAPVPTLGPVSAIEPVVAPSLVERTGQIATRDLERTR